MKTRNIPKFTCVLLLSLLGVLKAMSQENKSPRQPNPTPDQTANPVVAGNYTYRLFVAPNKVYGYDIFKNDRIIFHQPALAQPAGDKQISLTKKVQADKAATMAIEKIKKGMPAEIKRTELIQIVTQ